jgi:BirA family biotin operon repressor/biotin-[acetyl-CoA-carboxylase] ligase
MAQQSSTRETILEALRGSDRISGQELARRANVSRNAVWKHVRALRQEGYGIESCAGSGYRLRSPPDRLVPREIMAGLTTRYMGRSMHCYDELPSTQGVARDLAASGCPEGTVVLAEKQTRGRGRIGRSWSSLPGSVAMSVVLRPAIQPEAASAFPLLAGVAAAGCVEGLTGLRPGLKWPNDLLAGGRKVAGILAELSAELDRINHLVLGIGINVNAQRSQIPPGASSLRAECGFMVSRVELVRSMLSELERIYETFLRQGFDPVRQAWTRCSVTLGARVRVRWTHEEIEGTALDIDGRGALIVEADDGTRARVTAGDVRLRHRPDP